MRSRGSGIARLALIPVLLTSLLACGAVTGTAQLGSAGGGTASSTGPSGADVDPQTTGPGLPDPDTDPTADPGGPEPLTELDPVDEGIGRWLESRRIANQMPSPADVDPSLTIKIQPTMPLQQKLDLVLGSAQIQVVQHAKGLQAGFAAARRTLDDSSAVVLMVLEFETPEQAAQVAAELPLTELEHEPLTSAMPGATMARNIRTETVTVEATVATGTLLQYTWVSTEPDIDGQPLAEKALTTLVDGMSGFRITPAAERIALPDDRDGLVAHTLGGFTAGESGWYTAEGALHYQYDHGRAAATFDRAGVDLVVNGVVSVLRAADAPGARLIQADFLSEAASVGGYTELELDGMPASTVCTDAGNGESYCVGTVGRYAFEYTWEERDEVVKIATKQQNLLEQL